MNKRPLSVTVLSWVFIVFGTGAFLTAVLSFYKNPNVSESLLVAGINLLAAIAGFFTLKGFSWARWLIVGWLCYHVLLSLFHPPFELVAHIIFLGLGTYLLFRAPAFEFFRSRAALTPAH